MKIPRALIALTALLPALACVLVACGSPALAPSRPAITLAPAVSGSAAANGPGLPAFEARLRQATTEEGGLVRAIGAASAGSAADMRLALGPVRTWVDDQRAWLAANPGELCYDPAATQFGVAIEAMAGAADAFEAEAGAKVAPSDDVTRPSALSSAVQLLQDTARALAEAQRLAVIARPNCR